MCDAYLSGIEHQTDGLFDPWLVHATASVEALGGVLNELLLLSSSSTEGGGQQQQCAPSPSNPSAILLTPLPIAHFQVCGKTDACRALCSVNIAIFNAELDRVRGGGSPNVAPFAFDVSGESPLFNRCVCPLPPHVRVRVFFLLLPAQP